MATPEPPKITSVATSGQPLEVKAIPKQPSEAQQRSEVKATTEQPPEAKAIPEQPPEAKATPEQPSEVKAIPEQPSEVKATPEQPSEVKTIPEQLPEAKATLEQPSEEKATPKQPSEEKAIPEQPPEAKATPEQPSEEKATPKQPSEAKATPEQPSEVKAIPKQPSEVKATPEQPSEVKAIPKQPSEVKATPEQPSEVKTIPEQLPEAKATLEQPSEEKATPEQPSEAKTTPKQPSEEKTTTEQISEEKATPEQASATPEQPSEVKATPIRPQAVTPRPSDVVVRGRSNVIYNDLVEGGKHYLEQHFPDWVACRATSNLPQIPATAYKRALAPQELFDDAQLTVYRKLFSWGKDHNEPMFIIAQRYYGPDSKSKKNLSAFLPEPCEQDKLTFASKKLDIDLVIVHACIGAIIVKIEGSESPLQSDIINAATSLCKGVELLHLFCDKKIPVYKVAVFPKCSFDCLPESEMNEIQGLRNEENIISCDSAFAKDSEASKVFEELRTQTRDKGFSIPPAEVDRLLPWLICLRCKVLLSDDSVYLAKQVKKINDPDLVDAGKSYLEQNKLTDWAERKLTYILPQIPSIAKELGDDAELAICRKLFSWGKDNDEPMFIIAQVDYGPDNKSKKNLSAFFPEPCTKQDKLTLASKKLDIDLIIVHADIGAIIVKIEGSEPPRQSDIRNAATSLRKGEELLHLFCDKEFPVYKVAVFPKCSFDSLPESEMNAIRGLCNVVSCDSAFTEDSKVSEVFEKLRTQTRDQGFSIPPAEVDRLLPWLICLRCKVLLSDDSVYLPIKQVEKINDPDLVDAGKNYLKQNKVSDWVEKKVNHILPKIPENAKERGDDAELAVYKKLFSWGQEHKEPMFIIAQVEYDPVSKSKNTHSVLSAFLPDSKKVFLPPKSNKSKLEIDLVIVHANIGAIIVEIKATEEPLTVITDATNSLRRGNEFLRLFCDEVFPIYEVAVFPNCLFDSLPEGKMNEIHDANKVVCCNSAFVKDSEVVSNLFEQFKTLTEDKGFSILPEVDILLPWLISLKCLVSSKVSLLTDDSVTVAKPVEIIDDTDLIKAGIRYLKQNNLTDWVEQNVTYILPEIPSELIACNPTLTPLLGAEGPDPKERGDDAELAVYRKFFSWGEEHHQPMFIVGQVKYDPANKSKNTRSAFLPEPNQDKLPLASSKLDIDLVIVHADIGVIIVKINASKKPLVKPVVEDVTNSLLKGEKLLLRYFSCKEFPVYKVVAFPNCSFDSLPEGEMNEILKLDNIVSCDSAFVKNSEVVSNMFEQFKIQAYGKSFISTSKKLVPWLISLVNFSWKVSLADDSVNLAKQVKKIDDKLTRHDVYSKADKRSDSVRDVGSKLTKQVLYLNPEQIEVWDGPKRQIVRGVAGTGKTVIIQHKVLEMVENLKLQVNNNDSGGHAGPKIVVITTDSIAAKYKTFFDQNKVGSNVEIRSMSSELLSCTDRMLSGSQHQSLQSAHTFVDEGQRLIKFVPSSFLGFDEVNDDFYLWIFLDNAITVPDNCIDYLAKTLQIFHLRPPLSYVMRCTPEITRFWTKYMPVDCTVLHGNRVFGPKVRTYEVDRNEVVETIQALITGIVDHEHVIYKDCAVLFYDTLDCPRYARRLTKKFGGFGVTIKDTSADIWSLEWSYVFLVICGWRLREKHNTESAKTAMYLASSRCKVQLSVLNFK